MVDPSVVQKLEQAARGASPEVVFQTLRGLSLREVGELFLEIPPERSALGGLLPRMPSDQVQISWTGNAGAALLEQSLAFIQTVASTFQDLTGRPLDGSRILDYGCGWGRLIRLMYKFSDPDRIYGCDAWDHSLDLCRTHGIRAHLARCQEVPSGVPFPGVTFDLAYAFSVFTHLSERTGNAVAAVLRRCIADDGVLVVTIRPPEYWDVHPQAQSTVDTARMKREHQARGFAFAPHNRAPVDGEVTYGDTSMSLEHIQRSWPGWSVVRHQPDLADPVQQLVFLRPV